MPTTLQNCSDYTAWYNIESMDTSKLLTGNEAADYIGVHRQTWKNWHAAGRVIPSVKRGNLTLYTQQYLDSVKDELLAETRGRKKQK